MASIKISDGMPVFDDAEFNVSEPVSYQQFVKFADAANYLNFYTRRNIPYRRIGTANQHTVSFVYPGVLGGADYSTRKLTVVAAIREWHYAYDTCTITISSNTDTTGVTVKKLYNPDTTNYSATTLEPDDDSEVGLIYIMGSVTITGGLNEIIAIEGPLDTEIDGFGAWELPANTYDKTPDGGIVHGAASIADGTTEAIDPSDFYPGAIITEAQMGAFQNSCTNSIALNNRVVFSAGYGWHNATMTKYDPDMKWHTNTGINSGSFVPLPVQGIYIPPCADQTGKRQRIRGAVCIRHGNPSSGTTEVRLRAGDGGHTGSTWSYTASDNKTRWQPMNKYLTTDWPNTTGISTTIPTTGGWLFIDLKEDLTLQDDPQIVGVVLWHEGYV